MKAPQEYSRRFPLEARKDTATKHKKIHASRDGSTGCLHPNAYQVGVFQTLRFDRDIPNGSRRVETALAIVLGDLTEGAPLLRIHSRCFTGEALRSRIKT
jgi:GTP cyclohydrolase II